MIYIEGWKKLEKKGHVKIFTQLEDVFVENVEVKERVEVLKDKDGKETGKKNTFLRAVRVHLCRRIQGHRLQRKPHHHN